ncbi:overexpressed in colon carcinoma 1 protein-like [Toxotes jaculatrix]|uniref:overexpressed in colon carcinoma 1 protein-like n=1 Tax=Toxotes jaculatrix TaxID=941984 RepID=UPI001B3AE412|nr:overexpressed in colon carcinoma 1 protein-like [Toxotes jaculatrix]
MGCGNSSPTSSSSTRGRAESSSKVSNECLPEDDKRKNYGGVYVGLPTDLSNIPQVQIGSLRGNTHIYTRYTAHKVSGDQDQFP